MLNIKSQVYSTNDNYKLKKNISGELRIRFVENGTIIPICILFRKPTKTWYSNNKLASVKNIIVMQHYFTVP